jgi:hypothetical protein
MDDEKEKLERAVEQQVAAQDAEIQDFIAHETEHAAFIGLRETLDTATEAVNKAAEAFEQLAVETGEAGVALEELAETAEDAEPKRVAMDPAEYGLTDDVVQAVLQIGAERGERSEAARRKRVDLCSIWRKAGTDGREPPAPEGRNASYLKRARALLASAFPEPSAVDWTPALLRAQKLEAEAINGTNTYSRALRAYRDGLLQRIKGEAQ